MKSTRMTIVYLLVITIITLISLNAAVAKRDSSYQYGRFPGPVCNGLHTFITDCKQAKSRKTIDTAIGDFMNILDDYKDNAFYDYVRVGASFLSDYHMNRLGYNNEKKEGLYIFFIKKVDDACNKPLWP